MAAGDDARQTWQLYVRNLNWQVTQSLLLMGANAVDGIDKADVKEVRLCRAGQYFQGKLCSAFLIFNDRSKAELVCKNWDARAVPSLSQAGTSLTCKVEPGECSDRPHVFAQSLRQKDDGGQKERENDAVPTALPKEESGPPPPQHGKGDQPEEGASSAAAASSPSQPARLLKSQPKHLPSSSMLRMTAPQPRGATTTITSGVGNYYYHHLPGPRYRAPPPQRPMMQPAPMVMGPYFYQQHPLPQQQHHMGLMFPFPFPQQQPHPPPRPVSSTAGAEPEENPGCTAKKQQPPVVKTQIHPAGQEMTETKNNEQEKKQNDQKKGEEEQQGDQLPGGAAEEDESAEAGWDPSLLKSLLERKDEEEAKEKTQHDENQGGLAGECHDDGYGLDDDQNEILETKTTTPSPMPDEELPEEVPVLASVKLEEPDDDDDNNKGNAKEEEDDEKKDEETPWQRRELKRKRKQQLVMAAVVQSSGEIDDGRREVEEKKTERKKPHSPKRDDGATTTEEEDWEFLLSECS